MMTLRRYEQMFVDAGDTGDAGVEWTKQERWLETYNKSKMLFEFEIKNELFLDLSVDR